MQNAGGLGKLSRHTQTTGPYGKVSIIMAKPPKQYKPGQPAPKSGLYEIVGPRGGHTGEKVVSEKGKTLPPTDQPGQSFILDEPSGK